MRRRKRVHVKCLAVCRYSAMEFRSLPGCYSRFRVAKVFRRVIPGILDAIGFADLVVSPRLRYGLTHCSRDFLGTVNDKLCFCATDER